MRRKIILALAVPFAAMAGVWIWHLSHWPTDNQLADTLRSFGYRPLQLPTSHMGVGSLYYVDSKVRFFDTVCKADPAELEGLIETATGADLQMDVLTNGQFESNVKVDLGWLIKGGGTENQKQTVHFSLTDIVVQSISHENSLDLFVNMANRPLCSRAIAEVLSNGGYVCQGLKVLEATAEYKLDRDTQSKIGLGTTTEADVKIIVKLAVEQQSGQEVVERQGKVQSGKKLKYAVAMKPQCMLPPDGHFARVLPDSGFGRMANYLLFNVVEPFWPARQAQIRTADNAAD